VSRVKIAVIECSQTLRWSPDPLPLGNSITGSPWLLRARREGSRNNRAA
jgi:hypothetical protein